MNSKNYTVFISLLFFFLISASCNSAPLSTSSRWIVDQAGRRVKLHCVNWVSHLQPMIAEGLEKKPLQFIARQISSTGFNCVRFTWPTFMFTRAEYGNLTVSQSLDKLGLKDAKVGMAKNNPQFMNMNVVAVHKAVVDELGRNNLMVVLDNHISEPGWCCGNDDGNGFFGDSSFDANEWVLGLQNVARTYKNSPAVIGMSLRNELRGNRQNEADWYRWMQAGASTVHRESPNFLVIVSGLSFDTSLSFLKTKPFGINLDNKLVFEAHWYAFGIPADKWAAQSNQLCSSVTQSAYNNYLFLISGKNPVPVILSEFGIDERGTNEADNRYINCFLATAAENDLDWGLWAFQGSYMLREGTVNLEEVYGVMNLNWDGPRNQNFLNVLQPLREIYQDPRSNRQTTYILYHPQSGQCVQVGKTNVYLGNCKTATRWEQHLDNAPIKVAGGQQCLGSAGDGGWARLSNDCSVKWKFSSSSRLHLGTFDSRGKSFCLERNAGSILVTKQCLCVANDLTTEYPSCAQNPEVQWFKFVPTNV